MTTDKSREKIFSRRAAMLTGGQLVLFAGLGARMYYLQVLQSDRYRTLAEENRINLRLLAPPRGQIKDRFGAPMAINVQNYRVVIIREQVDDVAATLDRLESLLDPGSFDLDRIMRDIKRRRAFVPVTVSENLTWHEVSRLEVNAPNLPGVSIDVGLSRYYPLGSVASHVMGYVAAVSEKDLTGDPVLELPGFRIGKRGIERFFDTTLRGKAGNSQVEVNAFGRVIRELDRDEGQPGSEISLTLDSGLQTFTADLLTKENSAAAVVMDVHRGDILAMVSTPGFNPNAFSEGLKGNEWRDLVRNPYAPLTNKAIAGQYPPGSTFKIVVALAAMEAGIDPGYKVFCRGFTKLGNRQFHCWKKHGHGHMDMHGAIRESCDVYFYDIALKLGVDRISEMAERMGMGARFEFELSEEKSGLMPTRAWKKATYGQPWHKGETLIAAIGQGYVLATPLQLAVMTARLVNGGKAVKPQLIATPLPHDMDEDVPAGPEFASIGVSEIARKTVMEAMDQVVNHPRGTAKKSRIMDPALAMGGKTGTSQVRRISMAERDGGVRKNDEKPWKERDHALFVGFAPVSAPQYAVAVVVEHGGGGSTTAAPIASALLEEAQRRNSAKRNTSGRVADSGRPAKASPL